MEKKKKRVIRKRNLLSAEEIARKNPYKAILFLIQRSHIKNKKIKFYHLRYALLEDSDISLKKENEIKKFFANRPSDYMVKNPNYTWRFSDDIALMWSWKKIDKKITGSSQASNLNRLLIQLQKPYIDLIKKIPDGPGEAPYYRLTKKGLELFHRSLLHSAVDRCPADKLSELNLIIEKFLSPDLYQ